MSFLDHIKTCNRRDMSKFLPFLAEGLRVGWIRRDIAERLKAFAGTFVVTEGGVSLHPALTDPQARGRALDEAAAEMAVKWGTPKLRGERYRVAARFADPPLFTVDRGVVSLFGLRAYGVHVNGVVERSDGPWLWIGRRARDKTVAPGKLDNMVAGGQPAGLSLRDNLIKEAAEEADIPAALAAQARPVGAVSYRMEDEWGLKPDVMFCFDLDVPADFTPRNADGEMEGFELMAAAEAARLIRSGDEFKFNVNLVIIDFLIRRGLISPDSEPDYADIVAGLRGG